MQEIIDFLAQLELNNTRDWFETNRSQYEEARAKFKGVVAELLKELNTFESFAGMMEPKDCIFRINRDIRFSKDKRPYKNHMGAYFAEGGKKSSLAGYYLHLQAGNQSMLAGGMWVPESEPLKSIRQEIDYNGEELHAILNAPDFKKYYGGVLHGEKLKTTPKGYTADHPDIELLKLKSFTAIHPLTDEQVASPDFVKHVIKAWKALKPLNDFLNMAVS